MPRLSHTRRLLTASLLLVTLCAIAMVAVVGSAKNSATAPSMPLPVAPPNCATPGLTIVTDASGDTGTTVGTVPATAAQDITSVQIAEPYQSDGIDRLSVTMNVAALDTAALPASAIWRVYFKVGANTYFTTVFNDPVLGVQYQYGMIDATTGSNTTLGDADGGSINGAAKRLTVSVANSKVGSPGAGQTITGIYGRTQTLAGTAGTGASPSHDVAPNTAPTSGTGSYVVVGNAACAPESTPTPSPSPTPTIGPQSGDPRYQNYAAPNGVGTSAGEPSIGTNWQTGKVMYIANLRTLRITFDDCFSPAKALWEDKSAANTSVRTLDPILYTDHMRAPGDTTPNRTIVSQLSGTTSLSSYTDDDGETWVPSEGGSGTAGVDHQTVGGGPFHAPVPSGVTYPNATYYCAQEGLVISGSGTANCALSVDGGRTYGPSVTIYTVGDGCAPLHGHVKVAPDGTAYVPNQGCGPRKEASVLRSTDNGITWDVKSVPGSGATGYLVDPSVGIGTDGTVYLGYQNSDRTARIASSTNQGDTWMTNQDVGAQLGIKNSTFPEVVAGDGDRAAYAFLGSTTPGNSNDESYPGVWHLYVANTFDRGVTWTVTNVTPNDPVQRGSICNLGTTPCAMPPVGPRTKNDRNLLDFMDITVDKEGRALVAYPDGCITNTCINGGANDFSAKATIARQSGGKRLFSAYDPPIPAAPGAPLVTATRSNNGVHLAWSQPDNGGSPITNYRVYRRAQGDAQRTLLADVGTALSYDDTTAGTTITYFYSVAAQSAAGESQTCPNAEVSPGSASNPCQLPGVSIVTDVAGDTNPPSQPDLDIREAFVAEPFSAGQPDKLVWTMKVASLGATMVPNRQWYIIWTPSSGLRKYVAAKSDATGALTYEYGEVGSTAVGDPNLNKPMPQGSADAGSVNTTDGTFTITIANSKVGGPSAGSTLLDISPRSFAGGGNVNVVSTSAADLTTVTPAYTLVGNSSCAQNSVPSAQLSASPLQGAVPLQVSFDASDSSDPDAGDFIASYTFDFGDGSQLTQSSPTITHTYTSAGNYRALLTVTDSRGATNINVADAFINALNPNERVNYALAANGGTATGSTTYSSGFPASSAIDGDRAGRNWGAGGGWNDSTRDIFPDSLEVAFNTAKTIDEVRVYTLQDQYTNVGEPTEATTCNVYGLLDFDVQYWDENGWVTVPGGSVTGNDKVIRAFTFPAVTTTKVRVLVSNARVHYSRIVELEALGTVGQ
jgi:hypothetical protein